MNLETLIVSDTIASSGGKAHLLGVGTTRLTPPELPWNEPSLAIFLRFTLDEGDAEQAHTIGVGVFDPNGGLLAGIAEFRLIPDQVRNLLANAAPGELVCAQVSNVIMGARFNTAGVYNIVAFVDGDEVHRYPLVVIAPAATD